MTYTWEAAVRICKEMFNCNLLFHGCSALGSYKSMMNNIKENHPRELETLAPKLNELIMPYFEDIKANPNKVL